MVKFLGAAIIVLTSTFIGFFKSARLKRRVDSLREIESALVILKSEITFARNKLETAFFNISKLSNVGELFAMTAENVSRYGIKCAWENTVLKKASALSLTDEDTEVILMLGIELGMTDVNTQLGNIEYISSLIGNQLSKAENEYLTTAGMYRSMGVLGGLFLAVILI